jgi:hypothetical protein
MEGCHVWPPGYVCIVGRGWGRVRKTVTEELSL